MVLAQLCNKGTRQRHRGVKRSAHRYIAGSFAFSCQRRTLRTSAVKLTWIRNLMNIPSNCLDPSVDSYVGLHCSPFWVKTSELAWDQTPSPLGRCLKPHLPRRTVFVRSSITQFPQEITSSLSTIRKGQHRLFVTSLRPASPLSTLDRLSSIYSLV